MQWTKVTSEKIVSSFPFLNHSISMSCDYKNICDFYNQYFPNNIASIQTCGGGDRYEVTIIFKERVTKQKLNEFVNYCDRVMDESSDEE